MSMVTRMILNDALALSSGTISSLTGVTDYAKIDKIQANFVEFCDNEKNIPKAENWREAWEIFRKFNPNYGLKLEQNPRVESICSVKEIRKDSTVYVTVKTVKPDYELSDAQLISRIKFLNPETPSNSLYSEFVKRRNLAPRINAKEFLQIFNSVTPCEYSFTERIPFHATHKSKNGGYTVNATLKDNGTWKLTFQSGATGTCTNEQLNDEFIKL